MVAYSAEPVSVFGFPLGGELKSRPKECRPQQFVKTNELCWIGHPSVSKAGEHIGYAAFPNADTRPAWSAYSMFTIDISKSLEINEIGVETPSEDEKSAIVNSISARFGLPDKTDLHFLGVGYLAEWDHKEINIHVECLLSKCRVSFMAPKHHEKILAEAENAKKTRGI